jgi:hypothetical protein
VQPPLLLEVIVQLKLAAPAAPVVSFAAPAVRPNCVYRQSSLTGFTLCHDGP